MAAIIVSAVSADLISRAFFGGAPFFAGLPHGLSVANDLSYLLIAVLAVGAGLIGVLFQKLLYRGDGVADRLWGDGTAVAAARRAESCWGWCCWRSRRCTGSAIRRWTASWRPGRRCGSWSF